MSGGEYEYIRIEQLACAIKQHGDCSVAKPELRKEFADHLLLVAKACRAIEWNDSGDGDDNETTLILQCLGKHQDIQGEQQWLSR